MDRYNLDIPEHLVDKFEGMLIRLICLAQQTTQKTQTNLSTHLLQTELVLGGHCK